MLPTIPPQIFTVSPSHKPPLCGPPAGYGRHEVSIACQPPRLKEVSRNSILHKMELDDEIELQKGGYLVQGQLKIDMPCENTSVTVMTFDAPSLLLPDDVSYIATSSNNAIVFEFGEEFYDKGFIMRVRRQFGQPKSGTAAKKKIHHRKSVAVFDYRMNSMKKMMKKVEKDNFVKLNFLIFLREKGFWRNQLFSRHRERKRRLSPRMIF